jgi:NADH-quinone oxidoreductase subunit E
VTQLLAFSFGYPAPEAMCQEESVTAMAAPSTTNENTTVDLAPLDEVFIRYEGQSGALIPVLQKAQEIYGYLPPEVLQRIADRLDISIGKIYGVATFYAQFYLERRGRHILRVCDGTACHVKGAPALLTAIQDQYGVAPGDTSADGQLTLEIVYCMGSCALAPVAVMDGQVTGRMRRETLIRRVQWQVAAEQRDQ